jgi:hypothetical protein
MEDEKQLKPNREEFAQLLAKKFWNDYLEVLNRYSHAEKIEITEHLILIFQLASGYIKTGNEKFAEMIETYEDDLLTKYRSRLVTYFSKGFIKYLLSDNVIREMNLVTKDEFDAMAPEWKEFNTEDKEEFLLMSQNALSHARKLLYLHDKGDALPTITIEETTIEADEPDKGMTKARQLLAIYYFLKASLGIEGRDSSSISGIARFIHLLTGTKFTTVQNSDIYKKYLQMPNYKKDNQLITDLKFIRPYFVDLGLDSAVKMIDEEINRAIKELPFGERKKFNDL